MSRLNEHGTARSTVRNIEDALTGLWQFVADQGELRTLAIPLMGTGRGRIDLPRKKNGGANCAILRRRIEGKDILQ